MSATITSQLISSHILHVSTGKIILIQGSY